MSTGGAILYHSDATGMGYQAPTMPGYVPAPAGVGPQPLPPGVNLPATGPGGAPIIGGGQPPNPDNIVTDEQRQQMGGTQPIGPKPPPFDWIPKFSPQQNRIVATLNDQKSQIQQAMAGGRIRPQEAQQALAAVDQQISQIKPQLIPKMHEPSAQEEATNRIYVHPQTGMTFIKQPDGTFEMRPPSKDSPYLAWAKQQHEVAHDAAKEHGQLDVVHARGQQQQQLEAIKYRQKQEDAQAKHETAQQTAKDKADAEFSKWYSSAYDRHTQRLTTETQSLDKEGNSTKQRNLPKPDDVHGAVMDEWQHLQGAMALRHAGNAAPGGNPMGPAGGEIQPHPLLRGEAPPQAHAAAHELDGLIAKFGPDPKKWTPQARAHARDLQKQAKAFAKGD